MEKISEAEARERYHDMLDETKESWIKNYDGGRALEEIDPQAYSLGFDDFCGNEEFELEE